MNLDEKNQNQRNPNQKQPGFGDKSGQIPKDKNSPDNFQSANI